MSAFDGPTDLFILPGFDFRAVDSMITNFHLPRSSLIMLVSAFYGRKQILAAYALAKEMGYKVTAFHHAVESYKIGDLLKENGVCSANNP